MCISFNFSSTLFNEAELDPELTNTASLTSQLALESSCVYLGRLELQAVNPAYLASVQLLGNPNSHPYIGRAGAVTTDPTPQAPKPCS